MKAGEVSSTALLIARAILLADETPMLRPLLIGDSAVLTRRLLRLAHSARWFELAVKKRLVRSLLFAVERWTLPGTVAHWLARKCFLDGLAREALAAGCGQMVVLGAGLDLLAWRFRRDADCFELDHPATQPVKRAAFGDELALVPLDLVHESPAAALRGHAAFDPARPTLFVAEGLFMYLEAPRVAAILRELAALSAPGSRFAFTFMEARPGQPLAFANASPIIAWWLRQRGEPFRWGLPREVIAPFLRDLGWELVTLSSPGILRREVLVPRGLADAPLAVGESIVLAKIPA
jgi:methyltransferase (TIGR00027 family)